MALSLQSIKNRLARLRWLPGVSCLVTLNPQKADSGRKLFEAMDAGGLLRLDESNGHQLKVRIPQHHLLDSCVDILAENITDIRLYHQLPLHGLLTGRRKKQEEFAASVIQECLTPDLLEELTAWGITLTSRLETNLYGDIPVILFQLFHGKTRISDIALDGWCGLLLVNGYPPQQFLNAFSSKDDLHSLVRKETYAYLEDITT